MHSVKGLFSEEERQLHEGGLPYMPGEISRAFNPGSQANSLRVTDIDSFRKCPRRHFIERVLRLARPEMSEYEVEAAELGSIVHRAMELLMSEPASTLEVMRANAGEAIDKALSSANVDTVLRMLLRESFLASITDIYDIEKEMQEQGFKPRDLELEVEETLEGILLRGKIDRVQAGRDGTVALLDYKTGRFNISMPSALRGVDLQLFIYASILAKKGEDVKKVGIYALDKPRIKWAPNPAHEKAGRDMTTAMDASLKYLKETATAIRSGDFPARPLDDGACRGCPEYPYCPYIHGRGVTND